MKRSQLAKTAAVVVVGLGTTFGLCGGASVATAAHMSQAEPIAASVTGPPGVAMAAPVDASSAALTSPSGAERGANGSYTHRGPASPGVDLPPGNGDIMPSTTLYYVFWLPTGLHYEANAAGDTNYENLLIQWAQDLGSSQFHNLVTQYNGNNGTITNNVTYGGSWTDSGAYPHAGTTGDPLQDSNIRDEVTAAFAANSSWVQGINTIVAVFTANGIQECASFGCTFDSTGGFCAYHDHFNPGGSDTPYAFMAYDDFTHVAGFTCDAGQTGSDTDPNRGNYPNGDRAADAEINTLSHEVIEAETDPHPNDTWTAPNPEGEIGDACNFNFAPRNDLGADVYMNGHGYIMQQEYSNAAHNCAIDLAGTNGFCPSNSNSVCSPTTSFTKSVDVTNPQVNSTIHYTLTLNNTNDTGAETNLVLTDSVPAGYVVTGLVGARLDLEEQHVDEHHGQLRHARRTPVEDGHRDRDGSGSGRSDGDELRDAERAEPARDRALRADHVAVREHDAGQDPDRRHGQPGHRRLQRCRHRLGDASRRRGEPDRRKAAHVHAERERDVHRNDERLGRCELLDHAR